MSARVIPAATRGRLFRPHSGRSFVSLGDNNANTVVLLHMDGADTSTTFTNDAAGGTTTFTANGNAQVDTAQSKFGGASYLSDGTGDYLSAASHADFNLGGAGGGNDFTADFWVRFAAIGAAVGLYNTNNGGVEGYQLYLSGGNLRHYNGASDQALAWSPSVDTWYHVAIVRNGTTITAFIDGTSIGTYSDGDINNDSQPFVIGATNVTGSNSLNGWIDEFRLSKGVARWTANFTPPTAAYS